MSSARFNQESEPNNRFGYSAIRKGNLNKDTGLLQHPTENHPVNQQRLQQSDSEQETSSARYLFTIGQSSGDYIDIDNRDSSASLELRAIDAPTEYPSAEEVVSEINLELSEAYSDLRKSIVASLIVCVLAVLVAANLLSRGAMADLTAIAVIAAFAGLGGVLIATSFRLKGV